ncbi:hypothetical protein KI387_027568, partial [Taxus chinensis]
GEDATHSKERMGRTVHFLARAERKPSSTEIPGLSGNRTGDRREAYNTNESKKFKLGSPLY